MKKAVMYGAGPIGRGFIGQLLSQSGYEVVFVDVNEEIIKKLNQDRCYPIKFTSDEYNYEIQIDHVRAVDGRNLDNVAKEIATADLVATAVGVNVLPRISKPISKGLVLRWEQKNFKPLDIIICENMIDANYFLKSLIQKELNQQQSSFLDQMVGFVEASIGRMVPVMTKEAEAGNILRVCVEEYSQLPVDKKGFKGEIPDIINLVPFSPFDYYIHRKLFIHNMGHAITAYLGFLKGYTYIWEAVEDAKIREISHAAMLESAKALSIEHTIELSEIVDHVDQLIHRFGNRQLGDTIERVGRDLQRKLSPNDRLIGALNLCVKNGVETTCICTGIAAALCFKDPLVSVVTNLLDNNKIEEVLEKICFLKKDSKEWLLITNNATISKSV